MGWTVTVAEAVRAMAAAVGLSTTLDVGSSTTSTAYVINITKCRCYAELGPRLEGAWAKIGPGPGLVESANAPRCR